MPEKTGVNLVNYQATPLQAAFLEWGKAHPYGKLRELQFQDGVPVFLKGNLWSLMTEIGMYHLRQEQPDAIKIASAPAGDS